MSERISDRGEGLEQAKKDCLDKKMRRLFCCSHSLRGSSLREQDTEVEECCMADCITMTYPFSELTGTLEGLRLLSSRPDALVAVLRLIRDPETFTAKDAMRILINVSAEEAGASALLAIEEPEIVAEMVKVS